MKADWKKSRVGSGKGVGKTIGYPTLNLDPALMEGFSPGVYASKVKIKSIIYSGLLYFGPRFVLGETNNTLEIYLFGYKGSAYGSYIFFTVGKFIRPPKRLTDFTSLKKQLAKDVSNAQKVLR